MAKEFFPMIPRVRYEGRNTANPMAFRFYDPDEVILGKTMREQLKFAMSWWHTMCADGTDMFGVGTSGFLNTSDTDEVADGIRKFRKI